MARVTGRNSQNALLLVITLSVIFSQICKPKYFASFVIEATLFPQFRRMDVNPKSENKKVTVFKLFNKSIECSESFV